MGPTARKTNGRLAQLSLAARSAVLGVGVWFGGAAACGQPGAAGEPADIAAAEARLARMEDQYSELGVDLGTEGMTHGQGYLGALFGPSVTTADFDGFVRLLGFSNEQTEAAAIVYRQRLENYQAAGGPMHRVLLDYATRMLRQQADGGSRSTNDEDLEPIATAARRVEAERRTMRIGVAEDLKALLSPTQETQWPLLERAIRYTQAFRSELFFVSALHNDVAGLIERTLRQVQAAEAGTAMAAGTPATVNRDEEKPAPDCTEKFRALLEEHAIAVDAIAVLVIPIDERLRTAEFAASRTPEQMELLNGLHNQGSLLVERYRLRSDATVQKAGEIFAACFGKDAKEKFLATYQREMFPAIYRQLHGERLLEAAQKMKDLIDAQRQALGVLASTHTASLATLRPKAARHELERLQVTSELRAATDDAGRIKASERFMAIAQEDWHSQIRENDLQLIRQVRQLLTEDQRKRLPKRPIPKIMLDAGLGQAVAEEAEK